MSAQATIPFKCQKPRPLSHSNKDNLSPRKAKMKENLSSKSGKSLMVRSVMGHRRSPRKRLGLGDDCDDENLFTNEAVLDAIFKLSPHSPIKRTAAPPTPSSLVTSKDSSDITSPTRQILSPIRALSLNSPTKGKSSAVDKADKKRAQILQSKLGRTPIEAPKTPTRRGTRLNLDQPRDDETPVKGEVYRRVTRSSKKNKPVEKFNFDDTDDFKENEDPNLKSTILKPSPKKKPRILILQESDETNKPHTESATKTRKTILKSPKLILNEKENVTKQTRTPRSRKAILKSPLKPKQEKSVTFDEDVKPSEEVIPVPCKTPKSKKYLKLCKQDSEIYQNTKNAFHTCAPKDLIGREFEIKEISNHISECVKKQTSGSLYISGAPGTGKSACLSSILNNDKITQASRGKSIVININCMSFQNATGIYTKVALELGAKKKDCRNSRVSMKYLEDALTSEGPTVILLLDEMDQLDSKNQEVLYTMFEWPSLKNSRIMLIGIANSLDLTDRILPRLQLRVECKPILINFRPYSKEQIVSIIEDRIEQAALKSAEQSDRVIDKVAVQFCARKVAAVAGDARKALDICRRAVEVVEGKINSQALLSPLSKDKSLPSKVGLPQIADVLNSVYESAITTTATTNGEDSSGLPLQQKLAVCTLILLTRSVKCKVVVLGKFHESYVKICRSRQVTGVSQSEFLSILQLIESRGIISIKSAKQIRQTKINLALQEKDVEFAMQDKTLLSDVLQKGIPS